MIRILYTRLEKRLDDDSYRRYLNMLPDAIQNNIARFRKWQDAQRSLLGKLLLMEGLKKMGLTGLTLDDMSYSAYKRPFLNNADFNISHSGAFVICAISKINKVGIDIEEIAEIPVNEFSEQFSDIEISAIAEDKSLRHFYTLWTQKEAFLKAIGKGLHVPLKEVTIIEKKINWEGKNWFLHQVDLDSGYVSHLCTDAAIPKIILKEILF